MTSDSQLRRRHAKWVDQLIREAQERVEPPTSTFRQSRPPHRYIGCLALMIELIDSEPSPIRRQLPGKFGEMPWQRIITPFFITMFVTLCQDQKGSQ